MAEVVSAESKESPAGKFHMLVALIGVVILIAAAVGAQLFFRGRGVKTSPDLWVVSQLRQAGSNLSRPHDIEFFL